MTMRQRSGQDGLTVYQLLVSIVVIVIAGSLWMAFNKQQQQQSCLPELRRG